MSPSNCLTSKYNCIVKAAKRQAVAYIDNLEKLGILGNFKQRSVPITLENVYRESRKEINVTRPITGRVLLSFFNSENINYELRRTTSTTVYVLDLPLDVVYSWKDSLI